MDTRHSFESPDILLNLTEDIRIHTGATVRIGSMFSHRFSTTPGVRQGCVQAPALFRVATGWIVGYLAPDVAIAVGQYHFTDHADDAAIKQIMSSNHLISLLLHWALSYRGPRQNSKMWLQVTRRQQSS